MPRYQTQTSNVEDFVLQISGRQKSRRFLDGKFHTLIKDGKPTENPRFKRIAEALASNHNLAHLFATALIGTGQTKEARQFLQAYGYAQEALDVGYGHFQIQRIPKRNDHPSFLERYCIVPSSERQL